MKGAKMVMKDVIEALNKHSNFLIATHINMDGDSAGSQLALALLLQKLGKKTLIVNEDIVPYVYNFLPYSEKIKRYSDVKHRILDFDAVVVVDCGSIERIGKVVKLFPEERLVINIDHHISNTNFGGINWIDTSAASVGEMIYSLFKDMGVGIDENIALLLYTAVLTDSGSFRYSNTTKRTHEIAGEFLEYGLKPAEIADKIYEINPLANIKLLGSSLETVLISEDGKIAWIKVTSDMMNAAREFENERACEGAPRASVSTENFINYPRSIRGVEVAVFFKESGKGEIKVSFRSKGKIDVNAIAVHFNGGGHRAASGAVIKGKMEEVEKMVIEKVGEIIGHKYKVTSHK